MSHHHHEHHKSHPQHNTPSKKGLHRDWRFIAAAILMLIAILTYVLTMDESMVTEPIPANSPMIEPASP